MKIHASFRTFVIAVLMGAVSPLSFASDSDEAAIRTCFDAYKQALLNLDGTAAADCVDSETVEYYDEMRKLALNASKKKTRKLKFADRMMVLMLRHNLSREVLEDMDGKDLIRVAVEKGWISSSAVARVEMGNIEIVDDRAAAATMSNGVPTPIQFLFQKESDEWKLNLVALLAAAEPALVEMVKATEMTEDEFILTMLQEMNGQPAGEDIWKPLSK